MSQQDKKNNNRRRDRRPRREESEFDQKVLELKRVTRVSEGGKQMSFRACVAIGDGKGRIGVGISKGKDVSMAITKAVRQAEKKLVNVPITNETVPHDILIKNGASKLLIKPAKAGRGVKAGGVMRVIFQLAGVQNVIGKILGTTNKMNNAQTLVKALNSFKVIK